jgi:hypothetical protein
VTGRERPARRTRVSRPGRPSGSTGDEVLGSRRHRGGHARAVGAIGLSVAIGLGTVAVAAPGAGATRARAAHAQAKKALLSRSDFPAKGWSTSANPDTGNGWPPGAAGASFASCLGISPSILDADPPYAKAPEFDQNNDGQSVDEEVQVFPSTQAAAADVEVGGNPKTPACFEQLLSGPFGTAFATSIAKEMGDGAKVGQVTVTALPAPGGGQESAATEIAIPVVEAGSTIVVYLDNVAIAKGPEEASFTFLSVPGRFPASLAAHLEKITAQRLAG